MLPRLVLQLNPRNPFTRPHSSRVYPKRIGLDPFIRKIDTYPAAANDGGQNLAFVHQMMVIAFLGLRWKRSEHLVCDVFLMSGTYATLLTIMRMQLTITGEGECSLRLTTVTRLWGSINRGKYCSNY